MTQQVVNDSQTNGAIAEVQHKHWTFRYVMVFASYFTVFCSIHSYASIYLLDRGFNNSQIGILLAIANIISALIGPVVAGKIDKKQMTNIGASKVMCGMILVLSAVLYAAQDSFVAVFAIFGILYLLHMIYQSLLIALSFEYNKKGCSIMFGFGRGMGSVASALTSLFLGQMLNYIVPAQLPVFFLIFAAFNLLCMLLFVSRSERRILSQVNEDLRTASQEGEFHDNFFSFVKAYPKYCIFLLAVMCFFFEHNLGNDFLIQILRPIGGKESDMGIAFFIAAMLELPVMSVFAKVAKKIDVGILLKVSAVFFAVKGAILMFATNMAGVYLSECMQIFAYAIITPGAAYYATAKMSPQDQVKGQTYFNCCITIGGVFSSLIGGRLLDVYGTMVMQGVGLGVAILGIILVFIGVEKVGDTSAAN
ncbi:MAG: MFS transporter [Lachnospiraceae bacterium]|nr:MFS transporter [Lachnospiraceae bacterium]